MHHIDDWTDSYPANLSLDISRDLAVSHALQGGTVGHQIVALIRKDDIRAVCEFELPSYEDPIWGPIEFGSKTWSKGDDPTLVDWDDIEDEGLREEVLMDMYRHRAERIRHCRQALAFFQKLRDLEIGINRKENAFEKFLEAEEACAETNALFRKTRTGEVSLLPRVGAVLHGARIKIASVLGAVPDLRKLNLRFGPGATRGVKRSEACLRTKMSESPACSEDLLSMAPAILGELPSYVELHEDAVRSSIRVNPEEGWYDVMASVELSIQTSKLSFVPKNFKTYRSICVEPSLNVIYQAGLGEYLAMRLKKVGVDIRDQSRNQYLSRLGSFTGALATLDLSMASDTVATELVAELLPPDWFEVLRRARTSNVECHDPVTGRMYTIRQEKFSSMGNGFTFPLETLIFWALAESATEAEVGSGVVSVYGDDIIVPTTAYDRVVETLRTCGFTVNLGKSYHTGKFRESCGTDWYGGINVRPFYSKEWWSPRTLFVLHNFYVRTGDADRAKRVESMIHPALRIYGPDGYGDGHLVNPDFHPKYHKRHLARGFGGFTFETYQLTNEGHKEPGSSEYAVALYAAYQRASGNRRFAIRDCTRPNVLALQKRFDRGHGNFGEAGTPLPERDGVKVLALPGTCGYKKVSIYTF